MLDQYSPSGHEHITANLKKGAMNRPVYKRPPNFFLFESLCTSCEKKTKHFILGFNDTDKMITHQCSGCKHKTLFPYPITEWKEFRKKSVDTLAAEIVIVANQVLLDKQHPLNARAVYNHIISHKLIDKPYIRYCDVSMALIDEVKDPKSKLSMIKKYSERHFVLKEWMGPDGNFSQEFLEKHLRNPY